MASYKTYADNVGKYYYVNSDGDTVDLADIFEPLVHDAAPGFGTEYTGVGGFQDKSNTNYLGDGYYLNDTKIFAAARGMYPTVDLVDGDFPSKFWSSTNNDAGWSIAFVWDETKLQIGTVTFKPDDFRNNCIPKYLYVLLVAGGGGGAVICRISMSHFKGHRGIFYVPKGGSSGTNGGNASAQTFGSGSKGGDGENAILYWNDHPTTETTGSAVELVTVYGGKGGTGGRGTDTNKEFTTGSGGNGNNYKVNNSSYLEDIHGMMGGTGNSYQNIGRTGVTGLSIKPKTASESAPETAIILSFNCNKGDYNISSTSGSYAGGCSYGTGSYLPDARNQPNTVRAAGYGGGGAAYQYGATAGGNGYVAFYY